MKSFFGPNIVPRCSNGLLPTNPFEPLSLVLHHPTEISFEPADSDAIPTRRLNPVGPALLCAVSPGHCVSCSCLPSPAASHHLATSYFLALLPWSYRPRRPPSARAQDILFPLEFAIMIISCPALRLLPHSSSVALVNLFYAKTITEAYLG